MWWGEGENIPFGVKARKKGLGSISNEGTSVKVGDGRACGKKRTQTSKESRKYRNAYEKKKERNLSNKQGAASKLRRERIRGTKEKRKV